jgi:hypothetical protein
MNLGAVRPKGSNFAMIDYPTPLLNSVLVPPNTYKAPRKSTGTFKELNLIVP